MTAKNYSLIQGTCMFVIVTLWTLRFYALRDFTHIFAIAFSQKDFSEQGKQALLSLLPD
jgi:hypothetical protein